MQRAVTKAVSLLIVTLSAISSYGQAITIRALDGLTGRPIAHEHLLVLMGASEDLLKSKTLNLDLYTDENGVALLNLPDPAISLIQVWVDFHTQCVKLPNSAAYSMDQIRKAGIQGENSCGKATADIQPNTLLIYAREAHWWEKMRW